VPRFGIPSAPARYDVWLNLDGQDQRHVMTAVAALLGWDPRRAQKLVESGSPIRRGVRRVDAEYLRRRFADWGLRVYVEPDLSERPSEALLVISFGPLQANLGLMIGGLTEFVLMGIDPFGVTVFEFPQGVDTAEQNAALYRWKSSIGFILGQLVMAWIPLLVSGLCGVFVHPSRPASIPAALLRVVAVASLLLAVLWSGMPVVERSLGTGQSSDIQGDLARLAFAAVCVSLAAPLSSVVTRRRSLGKQVRPVDDWNRLA
jgi:hypothetical protein